MRGIELLQTAGFRFGHLAVVSKNSLKHAREIYRFFVDSGLLRFDFLPHAEIDPQTRRWHPLSITPNEFAAFLLEILDLWFEDNNPEVHIRTLENLLGGLLGARPTLCKFSGTCGNYLTIQPNGDIYPGDNFVIYPDFCLGNAAEGKLDAVLQSERYLSFIHQVKEIPDDCLSCQWYSFCNGGCPFRRYMLNNNPHDPEYFCETWKTVLGRIQDYVARVLGYIPLYMTTSKDPIDLDSCSR
jgi:uncharacterized protein